MSDQIQFPNYSISPFRPEYKNLNQKLTKDDFAQNYFDQRFGCNNWEFTLNGKHAIFIALGYYNLKKTDVVTILTTSGNFYISQCVTNEIEKYCKWNREITKKTKIIFVNHEFGYPYPKMAELLKFGLPIIEDCCTGFFSQNKEDKIGKYGEFAIYSFSKIFPIESGGLIVSNTQKRLKNINLDKNHSVYLDKVVSYNLRNKNEIFKKRKINFEYTLNLFEKLGFEERFENNKFIMPSLLILKNNGIINDLDSFKDFLWQQKVESSIFYGEDAFFIPNHQNLSEGDMNFFFELVKSYTIKYNSI